MTETIFGKIVFDVYSVVFPIPKQREAFWIYIWGAGSFVHLYILYSQ